MSKVEKEFICYLICRLKTDGLHFLDDSGEWVKDVRRAIAYETEKRAGKAAKYWGINKAKIRSYQSVFNELVANGVINETATTSFVSISDEELLQQALEYLGSKK